MKLLYKLFNTYWNRLLGVGFFSLLTWHCQDPKNIIDQSVQEYCQCIHEMEGGPLHLKCQKIAIRNLEDLGTDSTLIQWYESRLDSCNNH